LLHVWPESFFVETTYLV